MNINIYGDTEQEKNIDYLQKWFEENACLPNKIDRIYLTRFYYRASENVEETKKLLEGNFCLRRKYPNIFFNRDPEGEDTYNTTTYAYIVALPGQTPDKNRVKLFKLKDPNPNMVHFVEDLKTFIMIYDYYLSLPDLEIQDIPYINGGVIQIIDMEGFSMGHLRRISLRAFAVVLQYLQNFCPGTVKGIHLINCPVYVNVLFTMLKPFLSKDFIEVFHFHNDGMGNLCEYVPREMLVEEYGGNAGKISKLSDDILSGVRSKRNYLMDPNYWTSSQ
ncbi:alpha-tocopherol transfer protein-like [Haematobia irritans]|uniref:alpha-tocopherol transfer protein-like n=1 Tax=Haematobia irritans TaxID=7368 RepID=UPI003F4FDC4C